MTDQTLDAVRHLLTEKYDNPVQVDLRHQFDSPHIVLRCAVRGTDLPETVIVKHAMGESDQTRYHFRNELATLQFMGNIGPEPVVPRIIAAAVGDNLLVLEDFGDQPTLLDLLQTGTDPALAEQALVKYGAYLGRFHAASIDREEELSRLRNTLNATAPRCDTSDDVRNHADALQALFASFKISVPIGFAAEFDFMGRMIHEPGPFRVMAHCDAGPHNVFFLGDRVMLIDFEFGQYACGIMDLVSARMGFPHTLNMGRVPPAKVQQMEQTYQQEFPLATDNFNDTITAACMHWAFGRLSYYWQGYLKDYLQVGDVINADFPNYERTRRHQLTYIQSAKNAASEYNCFPAVADVLAEVEAYLLELWPELKPVDLYPVFQT